MSDSTTNRLAQEPSAPVVSPHDESYFPDFTVLQRFKTRQLRLHFSERKILLGLGDLVCMNSAVFVYLVSRYAERPSEGGPLDHWGSFVTITLLWILVNEFMEGTKLADAASYSASGWSACRTALLTSVLFILIPSLAPIPTSRHQYILLPSAAIYAVAFWRGIYLKLFALRALYHRVLVVGAGVSGQRLIHDVRQVYGSGEKPGYLGGTWVVGFIDDDPKKQGTNVEGIPVVGSHRQLLELVRDHEIDELILAVSRPEKLSMPMFQAVCACREASVAVTAWHAFYEQVTGRVPVELAGHNLQMVMPLESPRTPRFFMVGKRLLDIGVGLVGSLAVLALIPLVWVVNRFTSPGPLFYTQPRVGWGGLVFNVIKFRSMVVNAEQLTGGAVWAQQDDPRTTPMGRFLRKSRLDEFPQFWNMLRGDMSLVGPRPERPEFVTQLARNIPFFRMRHAAKPGITGWAQVRYPYGASEEDSLAKLQYDLYYIKHQSMFLEVRIILRTIMVCLGLRGR